MKNIHEIRDPIHVFIRLDNDERKVLDSHPFQRLRHIHQLAMTYLTYPGATHKRFEHSLGVMELASRVFDIVTNPNNVTDEIRDLLKPLNVLDQIAYGILSHLRFAMKTSKSWQLDRRKRLTWSSLIGKRFWRKSSWGMPSALIVWTIYCGTHTI